MIDDTINDDKTVAGGGKDVTLAGRYHIIRQLGQGGMGAVWLAEDQQLDNRKVAIKMLPTIIVQDKRAYQQLKGEALVSLKLIHPNIVTLRAFEENDGAPFLVMDYIEGRTLNDYLAVKGKLSEEETIKLLKPIAAALDYAHGEKVVHRDIKPSNVLIRNDGHPFILDFGIAREIQESMTRMTGGTISGTLLYMAPEQLRGASPKPAQDVYSFSAMAYECLTGQPPFIRGQIEYQIINEKPAPLPGGSRFVASIMAGLEKNPEARPESCAAVVEMDNFSRVEHATIIGGLQQEAIRARVEAKMHQKHLAWLPNENGFAERKRALEDEMMRAEMFFDSKGWSDAAFRFLDYVKRCEQLISLSNDMRAALPIRNAVLRKKEQLCDVINRESDLWCSLEETLDAAEKCFRDMAFTKANKLYEHVWEILKRCEEEMYKCISLPGGATMEIIFVNSGSFTMGSPETEEGRDIDETQHHVTLTKGFWLGKYPVTQKQWQSVMGSNPSSFKGDNLPVQMVSWEDCQKFIKKINAKLGGGARLPTEAEWEYACRAGTSGAFGGTGKLCDMGWCNDMFAKPHPVGQKRANAWGFYDMHGNVREWCNDWYGKYSGDISNPQGPDTGSGRVLRGGCSTIGEYGCRSASRFAYSQVFSASSVGVRLCFSEIPK